MAVKWRDYLSRKGLSIQAWIDANSISSIDGLCVRLEQLGIVLLPDDTKIIEGILGKKAPPVRASVIQEEVIETTEPVIQQDDRPSKKRRKASDQLSE